MKKLLISVSVVMATAMATTAWGAVTTFISGTSISSTDMNANFANLNGNLTDGACVGTPALTRVGPTCVETARRAANTTWSAAVTACRTAGRRLLTAGEYIAAKNQGVITALNGEFEWVDSVASNASAAANAGRLTVGYMGPALAVDIGSGADGDIFFATNGDYDVGYGFIFYRCAR